MIELDAVCWYCSLVICYLLGGIMSGRVSKLERYWKRSRVRMTIVKCYWPLNHVQV
jgi:hypothetical protein